MSTMAAQKVFGTYELCEAILLELPFEDLLQIRRVTKACKAITEGSIQLRQALYLAPANEGVLTLGRHEWTALPYAPHVYESDKLIIPPQVGRLKGVLPILTENGGQWQYARNSSVPKYFFRCTIDLVLAAFSSSLYYRMFLTQPPCTAILIYCMVECWHRTKVVPRDDDGVTLGAIASVCRKLLEQADPEEQTVLRARSGDHCFMACFRML